MLEANEKMRQRREAISEYWDEPVPEMYEGQKHLDKGTPERAYWHHGYIVALADSIDLIERETEEMRQSTEVH